jgi:hypothetical protein
MPTAMMSSINARLGVPAADGILVYHVADNGWLVRDCRSPDRTRLLGCIERRDSQYEVMQITDGFRWRSFDTLDAAVAHLAAGAPDKLSGRGIDEFAWLR